jgi:hypothetical protein
MEPLRWPAHRQATPSGDLHIAQKFILFIEIAQSGCAHGPSPAVGVQANSGQRKRSTAMDIRDVAFEPIHTLDVFLARRIVAQGNQGPDRRHHQRFAGNAVNAWVAAIPASAWTHAVVQHGGRKLAPPPSIRRKNATPGVLQRDECERSRLYPTAGSWRPAPSPIRIVDRVQLALRRKSTQNPSPGSGVARPIVAKPLESLRDGGR